MKFKKIIPSLIIPAATMVVPFAVTSCSSLPSGEIDKQQQENLLSSEAAKIVVLDSWLSTTYSSLYANTINPNASVEDQQKIANSILYFFENLTWPTKDLGTLVGSTEEIPFANDVLFSTKQKNDFETKFKDAYKFYMQFKSTIKETQTGDSSNGSSTSISPSVYFLNKSFEWKKNKYKPIVELKDNSGKILTIDDFNPKVDYNGCDSSGTIIEQDYKILVTTRGTRIFQEVTKLLLSEMYFLHATESQVKNATNFNKQTKNPTSVNYINTMSYVGDNNDFSNFMLKKYMVENSPEYTWSYSSTDYSSNTTAKSIVSTILDFNNLQTVKETTLSSTLVPASTENTDNSLDKLQAFNGLNSSSSTSSGSEETTAKEGDLANDIDSIKNFGSTKAGLYDTTSKMLFTFTELESIKQARIQNQKSKDLMIPSINIKSSSLTKKTHSITIDDLEILWDGKKSTSIRENVFEFTNSNGIKQSIAIDSISYKPSKTETKDINISFTYSFELNSNKYAFDYNFNLSNWGNSSEGDQINKFANAYYFAGDPEKVGISIFSAEGQPTGITYYLRALPLFKKTNQILIGDSWYMKGKFVFEGTPWETEEQKIKLIYFFMLSDVNLYKQIQDFYLFNNFNIKGEVSQLQTQISDLGLTTKTDADRKAQGII